MAVSFAGTYLTGFVPDIAAAIEASVSLRDVLEFTDLPGLGRERQHWTYQGFVPERTVQVGSLWWPSGARRFATAHFLADDAQLAAISRAAYAGGAYNSAPLVIDQRDPAGNLVPGRRIAPDMFLLSARPLSQLPIGQTGPWNGLWLLTFVDDRYWWWRRDTGPIAVAAGTTWDDVYAALSTALTVDIDQDHVPSAYLNPPSAAFTAYYEKSPLMLDRVAFSVGQRIVRHLDGTVLARNPVNAAADQQANLAIQGLEKSGGGRFRFQLGQVNDLPGILPTRVRVVFPNATSVVPHIVEVRLEALNLSDFGGVVTNPETATVGDQHLCDGTNAGDLQTLAEQFATDWYRFQVGSLDVVFHGIVPWVPNALDNYVEWHHDADGVTTRVQRGPLNEEVGFVDAVGSGGGAVTIYGSITYGSVTQTFGPTYTYLGDTSHHTTVNFGSFVFVTYSECVTFNSYLLLTPITIGSPVDDSFWWDLALNRPVYKSSSSSTVYPLGLDVDAAAIDDITVNVATPGCDYIRFSSIDFKSHPDTVGPDDNMATVQLVPLKVYDDTNTPDTHAAVANAKIWAFDDYYFDVAPEVGDHERADITLHPLDVRSDGISPAGAGPVSPVKQWVFDDTFFTVTKDTLGADIADITMNPLTVDATTIVLEPNSVTSPCFAIRFDPIIFRVWTDNVNDVQADIGVVLGDAEIIIGQGSSTLAAPKTITGDITLDSTGAVVVTQWLSVPLDPTTMGFPSDGDVSTYDADSGTWMAKAPSSGPPSNVQWNAYTVLYTSFTGQAGADYSFQFKDLGTKGILLGYAYSANTTFATTPGHTTTVNLNTDDGTTTTDIANLGAAPDSSIDGIAVYTTPKIPSTLAHTLKLRVHVSVADPGSLSQLTAGSVTVWLATATLQ